MGSKALRIDGKAWEYRDPRNVVDRGWHRGDRGSAGKPEPTNRNARFWTDPLYDYSKGSIQDAANELGIKNVDKEREVSQILEYIRAGGRKKEEAPAQEAPAQPEPEKEPLPPRGSTFTEETQRYKDTRLQNPGNQVPRMGYTDDPYRDAISHGEDLNAHYTNKFIPSLQAEARLTGEEIGESGRFNIDRFIGKVPELGDPKDLFAYYSDKLKESA